MDLIAWITWWTIITINIECDKKSCGNFQLQSVHHYVTVPKGFKKSTVCGNCTRRVIHCRVCTLYTCWLHSVYFLMPTMGELWTMATVLHIVKKRSLWIWWWWAQIFSQFTNSTVYHVHLMKTLHIAFTNLSCSHYYIILLLLLLLLLLSHDDLESLIWARRKKMTG